MRPGAHRLLAGLVDDALELTEDLRAGSGNPILHATAEALTATKGLLALAADGTEPDRRDVVLRDALDSIRAASTAIRFALVEEGDRQRSRRGRTCGCAAAADSAAD